MAFAAAFQEDAFQNDAFQVFAGETEAAFNPTGIGAVADFRGDERNQRDFEQNKARWEADLRRVIDEAFDGKPPEAETLEALQEVIEENQTLFTLQQLAEVAQIADQRRLAVALRDRQNRQALELLLMVA